MATASPASQDLSALDADPRLFLYTSLTAGSSHIITATSRLETILKANRIPFTAIDTATDEKARRLWGRRAGNKKLPGLVKEGFVLGDLQDLEQIEEWNEYGELKENIGPVPPAAGPAPAPSLLNKPGAVGAMGMGRGKIPLPRPGVDESKMRPLPGAAEIKARNTPKPDATPVAETKSVSDENARPKTTDSEPAEKEPSVNPAKALLGDQSDSKYDHLSAPASAMQSGSATPAVAKKDAEGSEDATEEAGKGKESKTAVESDVNETKVAPSSAKNADDEDEEEEDDEESTAKGVQDLQLGEGKPANKQAAKEPEDAGTSVED
ncbi:hypothetical protein LTR95_009655 [Oleoguttula sp. CCFEE 5521]